MTPEQLAKLAALARAKKATQSISSVIEDSFSNSIVTMPGELAVKELSSAVNSLITNAALIPEATAQKPATSVDTFQLKEKIAALSTRLLTADPMMPVLLREIHTMLRKDPEQVTLLEEEEIGIIVNGLKVQTNTELVTTAVKNSTTSALKKKGPLNVDMF